jgi:hypothetical protein
LYYLNAGNGNNDNDDIDLTKVIIPGLTDDDRQAWTNRTPCAR